jgi:hypothetical protein
MTTCAETSDNPHDRVERTAQHTRALVDRRLVTEHELTLSTAAALHQPVSTSLLFRVLVILRPHRVGRRHIPPRNGFLDAARMKREISRL